MSAMRWPWWWRKRAARRRTPPSWCAVEYEELPAVVDLDAAMKGKTQLFADAPGNLCVDWPGPVPSEQNERDVADIITKAPHVARVSVVHQRMVVASMETRGATGVYDKDNDRYTLRACSQSADALRGQAASIMGVPNDKLRVITEDVGGAFGMKTTVYPEYVAVMVAARKVGRPVHWQSTRSEAFMSDCQARDAVSHVELALDDKGKFLALRVRHLCNQGAYIANAGININTNNFARCLPGMYRIAKVDVGVACYFSNKVPIAPYRGAGRPEANYALERAVEEAARVIGMDPVRLRKKNLIPPSAMPFKTPINTYDSGDFPGIVDKALKLADVDNFNKRKRESARRKKLRGIGISCMLEHSGATPMEMASLAFAERRQDDPRLERAIDRAEPRHRVRAACWRDKLGIDAGHNRAPSRRHRSGSDRRRLGRFALGHVRRQRHCPRRRRDAGEGQEGRLGRAGSVGERHSISQRQFRGGRHRPQDFAVRHRQARQGHGRKPRHQGQGGHAAHVSERLPHRRGRDRSRHRLCRSRDLYRGGRLRQSARHHHRRGPGARQSGARARSGADRGRGLRFEAGNW